VGKKLLKTNKIVLFRLTKNSYSKDKERNSNNVTSAKKSVVDPVSADSANSHQGIFSLVQKANGISEGKSKQKM
jgi:hypothetical protein